MAEGPYTGEACKNCGRNRVEVRYDYWDKRDRTVCEKCLWDQEDGVYRGEERFSATYNDETVLGSADGDSANGLKAADDGVENG